MTFRLAAVFVAPLVLAGATSAFAAGEITPRAGILVSGNMPFPRPQMMSIATGSRDGSKLTVRLGFSGRCSGGGLSEVWVSNVPTRRTVRARDGRFAADLTGGSRQLGGVSGRTGEFRWRVTGRFTTREVAVATVTGTADILLNGRVVSRCKIAAPATVRLTRGS